MKVWKLVSGIFSLIFVLIVLLQSLVTGVYNTVFNKILGSGDSGGTTGIIVAVLLFIAGITSIAVRKRETKKAYTVIIVLFELAAMIGFAGAGNNSGLVIWAIWSFVCFIVAVFGMVKVIKPGIILKKQWWFWVSLVMVVIISAAAIAMPRGDGNTIDKIKKIVKAEMGPKHISSKTIKEAKLVPGDELDRIYSSPKKYTHRRVIVKGQAYSVEKTKKGIKFDLYSKAYSIEKISTIYYDKKDLNLKDEDYVIVDGVVLGENDVIDINLTYVNIKATKIQKSNYVDVFSPTIKTYTLNQTIKQHKYKVTLEKVELAKNQTRAYIKVKNKGRGKFEIYTLSAKLKQGRKTQYIDGDYILDNPKLFEPIKKGQTVRGIISFPQIKMNESFTLKIPAASSKKKENIKEYTFRVKVK